MRFLPALEVSKDRASQSHVCFRSAKDFSDDSASVPNVVGLSAYGISAIPAPMSQTGFYSGASDIKGMPLTMSFRRPSSQ